MKILLAGVGNIFRGDDAFGVEVTRRMLTRPLPEGVRVRDFGIRSFDLACALVDGYDVTILVDATSRGGAPGTLYTIEPDISNLDALGTPATVDGHRMDVVQVIRLAQALGGVMGKILVFGCEPETLGSETEGQMGLSAVVEQAVERAVGLIETLLTKVIEEGNPVSPLPIPAVA